MRLQDEIIRGLKAQFSFKSEKGNWMQQGTCPQCGKKEAFCASVDPKVVRCGRFDNCGWESSVRALLPELFEDWSKRFPPTAEDPNAAADAYMIHERGLNITGLRGAYSQETFKDYDTGETSATIRFPLSCPNPGDSYWERIIDKAARFDRKAHFKAKTKWSGYWWCHPDDDFASLASAVEIWLTEGIFDTLALREAGLQTVSLMSTNNYPEAALLALRRAIADGTTPKHRPKLVFAFDVGHAGVSFSKKYVARAKLEGWEAVCAQVSADEHGEKLDWNDLYLSHQKYKGDPEKAPLADAALDEYIWNGAVAIAETAREKAKLLHNKQGYSNFDFRHGKKIYSAKANFDEDKNFTLDVTEICNCSFRILYRERDAVVETTSYFMQIDYPNRKSEKARFTAGQCTAVAEFKKRLFEFEGSWKGKPEQLDRIMSSEVKGIRTVEPVNFTGYSEPHKAWILGDIAVREGRVLEINKDRFFDFGKTAVKRQSEQNILEITYKPESLKFDWLNDLWTAWGVKGLVALGFFTMSAFAVQIRKQHKSLGFLEITGEGGSGKTTLIEALWRSFGRYGYEGLDPNKGTVVFLARSMMGVSNLPVGLIEGNREQDSGTHSRQFDWNELLTLFNGRNPRGIGVKSAGNEVSEPPFLGSIYLMQNDPITAIPPVLERIMSMEINKASWTPETTAAAIKIEGMPMEEMSGTIIHLIKKESQFLPFFFDRYQHHIAAMRERVPGLLNARCIKCHSQLAAAVEALHHIFGVSQDRIAQTVKFIDQMALNRQQTSGGDHPLVAEFWEKVEFILGVEDASRHAEGTSLNKSRNAAQIAISLTDFEAKSRNAGLLPMDIPKLRKLLRNSQSRKFIASKIVNAPNGKTHSCWVFYKENAAKDDVI